MRLPGFLTVILTAGVLVAPTAHAETVTLAPAPALVPRPAEITQSQGAPFTLTATSHIVAADDFREVAGLLAEDLRAATGLPLPVTSSGGGDNDITLEAGPAGPSEESYTLSVSGQGAHISAAKAHGAFNGTQTLTQLLGPWAWSPVAVSRTWSADPVEIHDTPRYAYRGFMLDLARHNYSPEETMRFIDVMSRFKINQLHLHYVDDQGVRLQVPGRPELETIGARTSTTREPGGVWTQAQFKQVVDYATKRFVSVLPEIEWPGHSYAILNTYGQKYPDIVCSGNYVDFSYGEGTRDTSGATCPESDNSWQIAGAIMDAAKDSASPYIHVGGEEWQQSSLTHEQYVQSVKGIIDLVRQRGKTPIGWHEAGATDLFTAENGGILQYWAKESADPSWKRPARQAAAKGARFIMSPATYTYLDMIYQQGDTGSDWTERPLTMSVAYNWDPAKVVDPGDGLPGIPEEQIIGVEAPFWGGYTPTLAGMEYQVFPRIAATAEVAWTPQNQRDLQDFLGRVSNLSTAWQAEGIHPHPAPDLTWKLQSASLYGTAVGGKVDQPLGVISAPGKTASQLKATINWGDGKTSTGVINGNGTAGFAKVGLFSVSGRHTYQGNSPHTVTITVTTDDGQTSTSAASYDWSYARGPAPSGFTHVPGNASAVFSWRPSAVPVQGYWLQLFDGNQPLAPRLVAPNATSALVSGLVNGTPYRAELTALTAAGQSRAAVIGTVTPWRGPKEPNMVNAVAANGRATVTVTSVEQDPGPGITKVRVRTYADGAEIGGSPARTDELAISSCDTKPRIRCTLRLDGLQNDHRYIFTAAFADKTGYGAESQLTNAVRPAAGVLGTATNYFRFDETTGHVVSDSRTGGRGVLSNITFTEGGIKPSQARTSTLRLNPVVQQALAGDPRPIPASMAGPWSVSVRVKMTGTTPSSVLLGGKGMALKLEQHDGGKLGFTEYGVAEYTVAAKLPVGQWATLTVTMSDGQTHFYVDGQAVGTIDKGMPLELLNVGSGLPDDPNRPGDLLWEQPDAILDDLAVFDRVLAASEIQQLAASH